MGIVGNIGNKELDGVFAENLLRVLTDMANLGEKVCVAPAEHMEFEEVVTLGPGLEIRLWVAQCGAFGTELVCNGVVAAQIEIP